MKDKIILKGMKFYGYHGVLEEEKRLGQQFEVDLELFTDLQPAGKTDNLDLSVSYADVFDTVAEIMTGRSYNLLESVAETIAHNVLQRHENVAGVKVTVKKPGAPIKGNFAYMAVEITRQRGVMP